MQADHVLRSLGDRGDVVDVDVSTAQPADFDAWLTFAPLAAMVAAMARPMPFDAPVTSATFPSSLMSIGRAYPPTPATTGSIPWCG